ncbi:nuclear pore complex protein Nup153 isoform X2 [Malaya genurostris]|uniref:nuclear pore complex protein Nup153 isoform X2 n=1 Tax=Malaya genurostris TaxID=325434 RepID=UPI0026F3DF49|nr:nuclear pore complex protein Nup153 isoform X2 [Malaya genurostris]
MFQARSRASSSRSNEDSPSPSPSMAAAAATAAPAAALNTSSSDSNLDDDPNSSIIKKVRSRVSSILPDALSKWFSPVAAKRPRDSDNASAGNSPTGRNGNLLRTQEPRFIPPEDSLAFQEKQPDEDDDDDNDHAPPISKRTRLDVDFNTSAIDFNDDLSALPGPSGLNISAIDRRGSLPVGSQAARSDIRNVFTSSTPSTSPQTSGSHQKFNQFASSSRTTSLFGMVSSSDAASSRGSVVAPISEEQEQNTSLSTSIRHRRSIREIGQRKRLNIPPMVVDRSTSEPPAAIFGTKKTFRRMNEQQSSNEDLAEDVGEPEPCEEAQNNALSNGNLNESASESSSVSNLNLSQTEPMENRRLSGFMGNNRSKRYRVGGSTGDLCFSSHLETEKSLFSSKNVGGSGRPTFNASIYGSTSSLGSSNSSLFANSPFYNGRTMYGGASAYTARRDVRQKALRMPVQIRPSSSLSNFSSSNVSLASDTSALSNTAKRILEIMNQYSGPLNEARKLGSSLSLNSTLASAKVPGLVQARKRFNEEDLSINRSIRMSSPRTPYSRPTSATGNSSSSSVNKPPTAELQIPTMSQLLQMKRLQSNTESVRRLATESSSRTVLNQPTEYKLPMECGTDDSNNNVKHTSKMRHKMNRVRDDTLAERTVNSSAPQVHLPDVQLTGLKSVPKFDIKLQAPVSAGSNGPSESTALKRSADVARKETNSGKDHLPETTAIVRSSLSSGYNSNNSSTISVSPLSGNNVYKFSAPTKLALLANSSLTAANAKVQNHFKFSDPEPIGAGKSVPKTNVTKLTGIQFDPLMAKPNVSADTVAVTAPVGASSKAPLPLKSGSCLDALKSPAIPELKSGSCLDALSKTVTSSTTTASFGNAFKLTGSNKWECGTCMVRNDPDKNKCVACETPKPGSKPADTEAPKSGFAFVTASKSLPVTSDSGFKALVAQQSAKWECSDCMTRNDSDKMKCACCEKPKPGAAPTESSTVPAVPAAVKSMFSMPVTSTTSTDKAFKALAAQQSANKWECSACMTRNEASRSKCACCEQAKPGSTPDDAPSFSFGSKTPIVTAGASGTKFTFGSSSSSSVDAKDTQPKTGFIFGVSTSSSGSAPAGGFRFGAVAATTTAASSAEEKSKITFGSSTVVSVAPSSGFSFGSKSAVSSLDVPDNSGPTKGSEVKAVSSFESGGFSFGAKPMTDGSKKSETVTSTTTTTSGFTFGSPSAITGAVLKSSDASKSTGFTFGKPTEAAAATASSTVSTTSPVIAATPRTEAVHPNTVSKPAISSSPATSTTPAAAFSFGSPSGAKASGMVKSDVAFSFGSPKTSTAAAVAETTTSTGAAAIAKVSPAAAPAVPSVPIFGGAQKPTGPSITPSFSFGTTTPSVAASGSNLTTTATVAPSFSFGANTSKTTDPSNANAATSTTTTTNFVFGQSSQPTKRPASSFGAATAAVSSVAATSSDNKPTFGTFGASNIATSSAGNSIFGGATSSGPSGFSFGGSSLSAPPKPAESTTSAFTFGANNPTAAAGSAPVFGAAAASSAKSVFGSPSSNTNSSSFGGFGANSASNNTATFGSSTFGGASQSASSQAGSIFGQSSVSAFGSNTATSANQAPAFGIAPAVFGGANSASSPFGAPVVPASNVPSTDEPQTKKPFEFGSSSSVNNQSAAPFQFGANSNNNNNNDNAVKPFSFSAHSAPSFNFTAGSNPGQSSAPFTFGSNQNLSNPGGVVGGIFNFGGGTPSPAIPGIGISGMAEAAPVAAPAFQFGAGAMPQQNPFAATAMPGQTTLQQARRKIRATRRIPPR